MNEKQEAKFIRMTTEPVGRLVCELAVPTIIAMMVTAAYNMADTFFVGMLHSNSATGAVGVVFSLMAIFQAVGFFFGHGSTAIPKCDADPQRLQYDLRYDDADAEPCLAGIAAGGGAAGFVFYPHRADRASLLGRAGHPNGAVGVGCVLATADNTHHHTAAARIFCGKNGGKSLKLPLQPHLFPI